MRGHIHPRHAFSTRDRPVLLARVLVVLDVHCVLRMTLWLLVVREAVHKSGVVAMRRLAELPAAAFVIGIAPDGLLAVGVAAVVVIAAEAFSLVFLVGIVSAMLMRRLGVPFLAYLPGDCTVLLSSIIGVQHVLHLRL